MQNKVCLFALNGSYTHTSLAIRCLRKPLEEAGYAVTLLERNLRDRNAHILHALAETGADIYGFSVYIWNVQTMLSLAADLKTVRPSCRIVFGGPEVSYDTERFDGMRFIDAIVCGEGEEALPALLMAMLNRQPFERITRATVPQSVMHGEGILYRKDEFDGGCIPVGALLYYESSRGCPYHCAYCLSSVAEGLRMKTVSEVCADMRAFEALGEGYKIIKFIDRTFNCIPQRANEIWRALLSDDYTKHYHFEICASLLNEESFSILSQFPRGKIQLECGLQSTNPQTLEAVSRHILPERILSAAERIHAMGNIHIHLDLIAGLPYETYARFQKSFDEAYFCCDLLQLGFLKLLHGTALRRDAGKYGICFQADAPYTVLATNWITYEEITRLQAIAETLERYRESGKFAHTLSFLLAGVSSPFAFFEGLTEAIQRKDGRCLQKISQVDAYRLLYAYACTLPLSEAALSALETAMHTDYEASENRRMPMIFQR